MKRKLILAAAIAAVFSAAAWAQWGPGYGMGPGMMGGYYGMGPGMMWGDGPGGMGPGMMGGYGMRGGDGPGMMWGYGGDEYRGLKLTAEQRAKIADIRRDVSRKHWELMGKVHDERYQVYEYDAAGKLDENAARKAYQALNDAHKALFEYGLEARKRIEAVLTDEQRDQLRRGWQGR
jgi:Spy/CpxP family protein refolding chaperone